jgi:acyl-ACP thioesterase
MSASATPSAEMVPAPVHGRVFERPVRPSLADAAPSGRVRLDALARWLQDVAYEDIDDAGLAGGSSWVVRHTRMAVARFPRFGEHLACRTFCSGLGRMWAERRTTLLRAGSDEPDVEAVALWIPMDARTERPVPLDERAHAVFGPSAGERRVRARLRHQEPGAGARGRPWRFRSTETDLAGHINNAAYWAPLEDELLGGPEPLSVDAEMEFRSPSQPGDRLVLREGNRRWIADSRGELYASAVLVSA